MEGISKIETVNQKFFKVAIIIAAFVLFAGFAWYKLSNRLYKVEASTLSDKTRAKADKKKKARAAFNAAAKVILSPRCVNCHPAGDSPLQGDTSKLHDPEVMRGTEGRGAEDLQCAMCHLEKNTDVDPAPPGVTDWHMPSAEQKMIFQGLTAGELCRNLKDPQKNGGRKSAKEVVEHLATDPKVLWAWSPGNNRTIPAMSHAAFIKKMNEWVANGAACPD